MESPQQNIYKRIAEKRGLTEEQVRNIIYHYEKGIVFYMRLFISREISVTHFFKFKTNKFMFIKALENKGRNKDIGGRKMLRILKQWVAYWSRNGTSHNAKYFLEHANKAIKENEQEIQNNSRSGPGNLW